MRFRVLMPSYLKYLILLTAFWIISYTYVSVFKTEVLKGLHSAIHDVDKVGNSTEVPQAQQSYELFAPDDGITPEAKEFMKQLGFKSLGENGEPIELPANLSDDIQKRIKFGYDTFGYNAFASSMVSLNRNIPDIRSDVCKNKVYENLPKCSIVIPFHDDDWMLLMRTVHSILNRSPLDLIEEILLVDDASERG